MKARASTGPICVERCTCSLCRELGACASVRGSELRFCFGCALSMAQLIAAQLRASQRPHRKPCTCNACITFDEGQRGEVANVVVLDEDRREISRWAVVEVDP